MSTPLICSFERFEDAELARARVLAQGLPAAAVALRVIDDEAGPVEGNFVSGNGRPERSSPPDAVVTGGVIPYERNFARTVSRGVVLLSVDVGDGAQRQRLATLLAGHGGRDVAAAVGDGDRGMA